MTQFTANEVRDWERAYKGTGAAKVFGAFADLLEADEKAVPVMVVNHVSSAEHDLPIGMKLYTHPASTDAERLEEQRDDAFLRAVQEARRVWMDEFPCEAGHDHVTPFDQFLYGNQPCMEAQPPAARVTDAKAANRRERSAAK